MIYELAKIKDLQAVYDVVQHTINTIYPKYYPAEVVDFFCEHHSKDAILKDIENGYVSEQTLFLYHQTGNFLWAEYSGGDILKGSLIGTVLSNGELDFVYHHMNRDMKAKTGKCHSVPTVLEDGKIELSEQWEWTSGDCSKGESLLVEV